MSSQESSRPISGEIEETANKVSESESEINIDINFRIIEQFSAQLYDNPRRAIEELVCNSYDAGAQECYISTPEDTSDRLLVLDDGESMDMEGIEWLWTVAESPKTLSDNNRVAHNRQQIGKFGVGKLAAFALGSRLTYIATKDDTTRVISVNQNQLKDRKASDSPPFPVYEINRSTAENHFSNIFEGVPNPWEKDWDTWTLALVEEIPRENTGNQLMPWHLKRMINSSIPISSRFQVYLNDEQITKTERDEDPIVSVSVNDTDAIEDIERKLKSYWKSNSAEYDSKDEIPESKYRCETKKFEKPDDTEGTVRGIQVPGLGPVMGRAEIYESKLTTSNQDEHGFEDHGFRIYVRGKLLNRHDPKWSIDEIGYKWWKQFTAELEIPELDEALLVQRDSTKRDRRGPEIAKQIAHALYNTARRERDQLESTAGSEEASNYEPKSLTHRVGRKTPSQTYEAVSGLSNDGTNVDPDVVEITQKTQNSSEFAFEFEQEEGQININEEHPLYKLLVEQQEVKQNLLKTFGEVYGSCLLLLGYLRYNLDEDPIIDEAEEFFDYALRSAADSFLPQEQYLKSNIEAAAVDPDRSLSEAVANAFHHIRFGDVNRAESGEERYVEVPLSSGSNPKVSIKTLGTRGKVRLGEDDLSTLEPGEGFDHTFCVCKEYGADKEERNKILESVPNDVTLATIDGVHQIVECHYTRRFTYSQTVDILYYSGEPEELVDHIEIAWRDTPDKALVEKVLAEAHKIQKNRENIRPSIGALTVTEGLEGFSREEISGTVEAISILTGRVNISSQSDEFYLNSSPEDILEELGNTTGIQSLQDGNRELRDFNS